MTPGRALGRGAIVGATVVVVGATVVAAGAPARESLVTTSTAAGSGPVAQPQLDVRHVDPSTLPRVTVDPEVTDRGDLSPSDAQDVALTLAENLEVEGQALRRGERSLLPIVDDGDRLSALQERVDEVIRTGRAVVPQYTFDSIHVVLVQSQGQAGLSLGLRARGTVERVTYGVNGQEGSRETTPFRLTFVLSRPTGERWVIVDTQPID